MSKSLPSIETLKAEAAQLRAERVAASDPTTHSQSLELVARHYGYRDWNTARAATRPAPAPYVVGQIVQGRYLGQAFRATILNVSPQPHHKHRLDLQFETPVDVVTSDAFSNFRRRVSAVVTRDGTTLEKTSDGQPHMVLNR